MGDEAYGIKGRSRPVIKSSEMRSFETWKGITRKVMVVGENLMLLKVTMQGGFKVPPHKHPNEQVGCVIEGEIKIRIGEEWYTIEPGDSYAIPPNVEHEQVALKPSTVIEAFCPPVEAFKWDLQA